METEPEPGALNARSGTTPAGGVVPDVSVVIVSWNTRTLLQKCLASVFECAGQVDLEVFVVDNASHDGSAEMVVREFPAVRLIRNTENRGFAAANNQALPLTRGRYVLLLNPDTVILERAIQKVVAFADTRPEVGVVGCRVLQNATELQDTCSRFPGPLSLLLIGIGLHRLWPRSWPVRRAGHALAQDTERNVDVVAGMFMLVRRSAMEQVGLLDEDYFVYGEEADWCFRFWKAGWPCVFTPTAEIIHHEGGGQSTSQVRVKMFVQLHKSLLLFNRKNLGIPAYLSARAILAGSMALRCGLWLARLALGGGSHARGKLRCATAALAFHLFGRQARDVRSSVGSATHGGTGGEVHP